LSNEDITRSYLKHYQISRIIYFSFRKILRLNDFESSSSINRLNTFCIFLLIIDYLQKMNFPINKKIDFYDQKNSKQIADIFINLFHYYGYTFDYRRHFIKTKIIKNPNLQPVVEILEKKKNNFDNYLVISNPDRTNIVLTKCFKKTKELKSFFKICYIRFFNDIKTLKNCRTKKKSKFFNYDSEKTYFSKNEYLKNFNYNSPNKSTTISSEKEDMTSLKIDLFSTEKKQEQNKNHSTNYITDSKNLFFMENPDERKLGILDLKKINNRKLRLNKKLSFDVVKIKNSIKDGLISKENLCI
jgi:hypothetical protein